LNARRLKTKSRTDLNDPSSHLSTVYEFDGKPISRATRSARSTFRQARIT